jgi:hypothetical protein
MYATSGTTPSSDDHLGAREGTRERDVWLAHGDASALDRFRVEHALGNGVADVLEIVQRFAFDYGANGVVKPAIIHELTMGDPRRDIDLERLRHDALMRENAHENVEAQTAQRDLVGRRWIEPPGVVGVGHPTLVIRCVRSVR